MLLVQCDFDDTITIGNVSNAIKAAFGTRELRLIEKEYHRGKLSVEETNIKQFGLLKSAVESIEDFVLSEVIIRDGFSNFVHYCLHSKVRLVVVSSGLDLYIHPILKRDRLDTLEVHSGKAHVTENGINVKYPDPTSNKIVHGFKESFLRKFKSDGNAIAYIGDGLSDIIPASEADFVIAKSTLQKHLESRNIQHYGFETFTDVIKILEAIQKTTGFELGQ